MIGWFCTSGRPIHVLLTRSDKLTATPGRAATLAADVRRARAGERVTVQLFSSLRRPRWRPGGWSALQLPRPKVQTVTSDPR